MNSIKTNESYKLTRFLINKKDLEQRTKQIEQSLQPLINQILTPNPSFSSHLLKGRSKNAHHLVEYLEKSIHDFLAKSYEISAEYTDVKLEIENEIENVKQTGVIAIQTSNLFAHEPFSSQLRLKMGNASNDLLKAVGRLLAIADMIEEYHLSQLLEIIETEIYNMKISTEYNEFVKSFISYSHNLKSLIGISDKVVKNIKDPNVRDDFVSSRAKLNKQALLLFTSTKTAINLNKSDLAQSLKNDQFNEAYVALKSIKDIVKNLQSINNLINENSENSKRSQANILDLLASFDKNVNELNTINYNESGHKLKLQKQLNSIIQKILLVLTSKTGVDLIDSKRKKRIADELNQLITILNNLLSLYDEKANENEINKQKVLYLKKSKSIRKKILKSIADQFSSNEKFFYPIHKLIYEALNDSNDQAKIEEHGEIFSNEAEFLFELCNLACSVSNNLEGCEYVQVVIERLKLLLPNVINSAYLLYSHKELKEVQVNMETFKNTWLNEIKLLILAIDDITLINEFLYVSEHELFIDLNKSIKALYNKDLEMFEEYTRRVISRVTRICDVVQYEMNNYELCEFTNKVYQQILIVRNQILKGFQESARYNIQALSSKSLETNENEFIDSARLIYDVIREVRKALLLIPHDNAHGGIDLEDELMLEDEISNDKTVDETKLSSEIDDSDGNNICETSKNDVIDSFSNTSKTNDEISSYDERIEENEIANLVINANMTEAQKMEFYESLNSFCQEKTKFDREVLKWDDNSNDIIVLSKEMCVIMMDMTNFTRDKGPYKTIPDIIGAAKKISVIGAKLEKLVRELANQCPESQTKRELLGYLNLIPLFCNQLNIGSKVKENVIDPDSASSLIISSKNLMNTVISVVKASYVASTKYTNKTENKKPIVQWRMKPPELKPLIYVPKSNEVSGLIRKGSQRAKYNPIKALSEFDI